MFLNSCKTLSTAFSLVVPIICCIAGEAGGKGDKRDVLLRTGLALKLVAMGGCCLYLTSGRLVRNYFEDHRVGHFKHSGGYMIQHFVICLF